MVFWSDLDFSEINHFQNVDMKMQECHSEDLEDCVSICCVDNDFNIQSFSNIISQNNKKDLSKIKYFFYELSFDKSYIYEWNLIGNISPPLDIIDDKKTNYLSLVWIIKSNT